MGMELLDKGDTWIRQKLPSCLAKFLELWQTPLSTGDLLTPGHNLTIVITRKVSTSWFGLPDTED